MQRTVFGFVVAVALALLVARPVLAGGDWNDKEIGWQPYEEGLAAAKKDSKPILLVFYTDWCPHCTNYSKVFHDPKVVAKSKEFVMIRIDKDQNAALSKKYAPDGEYIPRTFFLRADGELVPDIHEMRPQFKYFYDENKPASLLMAMNDASKKLITRSE